MLDDEVILPVDLPIKQAAASPEEQIAVEPSTANQSGSGWCCSSSAAEGVGLKGGRRRRGQVLCWPPSAPGRASLRGSRTCVSVVEYLHAVGGRVSGSFESPSPCRYLWWRDVEAYTAKLRR